MPDRVAWRGPWFTGRGDSIYHFLPGNHQHRFTNTLEMEKKNLSGQNRDRDEEILDKQLTPVFTDKSQPAEIDKFNPIEHISTVFYIRPEPLFKTEKPYFMNVPVKHMSGLAESNVCYTRKLVSITNIRGYENLFSLDKTGFEIGTLKTSLAYEDFDSPTAITTTYYAEIKQFLMERTGGSFVLPFDYQASYHAGSSSKFLTRLYTRYGAVIRACLRTQGVPLDQHNLLVQSMQVSISHPLRRTLFHTNQDQTRSSAIRRLKYFHPEEAAKYDGHRVQIVKYVCRIAALHEASS